MYKSPINAIYGEITDKILKDEEENIMLEVQRAIGYAVDKDELIKALQYDRHQYEKGFNDAKQIARWIPIDVPEDAFFKLFKCSNCGFDTGARSFNYCPNCGAKIEIDK